MPRAILTPAQQEAARQGRREQQSQKAAQAAATVEALLADAGRPLPSYALSHAAKARKGNTRSLIALKCLDSPHIARSRQGRSDVQVLPTQGMRANLWLQGPFGHTSAEREGARDSTLPPRRAGYFSPDGAFRGLFVAHRSAFIDARGMVAVLMARGVSVQTCGRGGRPRHDSDGGACRTIVGARRVRGRAYTGAGRFPPISKTVRAACDQGTY